MLLFHIPLKIFVSSKQKKTRVFMPFTLKVYLEVRIAIYIQFSGQLQSIDLFKKLFQSPQALVAFEATLETVFIFFLSSSSPDVFLKIMFFVLSCYLWVVGQWTYLGAFGRLGLAWVCLFAWRGFAWWLRVASLGCNWPCLILSLCLKCLIMLNRIWPCLALLFRVRPYITMFGHA